MPPRPRRAPDRLEAGYRRFQRSVARTTERTDLNNVAPWVARRVRRGSRDLVKSIRMGTVVGVGVVVVLCGVLLGALAGSGSSTARLTAPVVVDDAEPVSLAISGGFGVEGGFTREPDPLSDPNADESGAASPLSGLLEAFTPRPGGGGSTGDGGGSNTTGPSGSTSVRPEAGAPASVLSNPELVSLFEQTNAARTSRGLTPLVLDTSLNRSAQAHADWMASSGLLCHSNECDRAGEPDASVWNGWGENIGYTTKPTANVIQTAFLGSPSHKANMLDPRHRYVGLGWAAGYLAGTDRGVVFVVVQFGMDRR